MTFNNEAQGAEVTKCVKIVDWNTKKLTDAVEVAEDYQVAAVHLASHMVRSRMDKPLRPT